MAIKVVADTSAGAGAGAENRSSRADCRPQRNGQHPLLVHDGIPDHEDVLLLRNIPSNEDTTVAGVQRAPVKAAGKRRAEGGCGHEAGVAEESQHWGRVVELAEPAAEAGAGDEAAPWLADEGGAEEARRFAGREAEEDLLDELLG